MHVELLSYATGEPRVMGTVSVSDGEFKIEGNVPDRIKDDIAFQWAHTIPKVRTDAFLLKLTKAFSGAYYRARLVR